MTGQGQKRCTYDKQIDNDSVVTEPKEIANNFNNYCTKIAEILITKRNVACTTNASELKVFLFMDKTNTKEVVKIIKNIRGNASPGHDGIKPALVKSLSKDLAAVFQLSLMNISKRLPFLRLRK
ncbi:hypothetical protein HHI36_002180 [Cryptolaemus montrouzieri]|uniref:Uncharacterized protein n=1 Tax=Cryptolaemus montrouzieri TaxID=559131 RepID=A0ABD2P9S1_9CUCU